MVSFWKSFSTSRELVSVNIRSVLEAILELCTANLNLLTQQERSSFMDEYSSLADARLRLNKGTPISTLTATLDECEKLKLKIERACSKHREDEIRRGPVSPAIATHESSRSSTVLIDPDLSYRTPSSEPSISVQSNVATTGGNSSYPSLSSLPTGTSTSTLVASTGTRVINETTSSTSTVPTETGPCAPPTDVDCMIFGPESSVVSPTFNIDSQDATGATHSVPADGSSLGLSAQRLPSTGAYQPQTVQTMTRERVMYFAPGTTVGSPTFNIRSPRGSGTIEQVVSQRSEMLTESFR
ncbi:uncharacterized protein EDB93DRAFT_1144340 [Suillus bovinus]|uniref:uncharacterized protein n=1 Tax=Suillus bovinus TaxID=48563 RepID=UPI001B8848AA|nr:uncharacterized protein EDB93DRAFT_1144340 [Suillus bovinus]KAG2148699.1 hypothetical protein EDB93DRAFT_1144340 [Suillus bovinus]